MVQRLLEKADHEPEKTRKAVLDTLTVLVRMEVMKPKRKEEFDSLAEGLRESASKPSIN